MKTSKIFPFVLCLLTILIFACSQTNQKKDEQESPSYTITGKWKGEQQPVTAYLFKRENGEMTVLDSVKVANGGFTFSGKVALPELRYITFDRMSDNYISFFAENTNMMVSVVHDSIENATVTGSSTNDQYESFLKDMKVYDQQLEAIYSQYKKAETDKNINLKNSYETQYDSLELLQNTFIREYVNENTTSVLAPYLTLRYLIYTLSLDELKETVAVYDSSLTSSVYTIQLNERIDILSKTAVGQQAVDFSLSDTSGKSLRLSSLYGNYLLIDFWASWCGPCRRENPHVVSLYKEFHPKGFEILGVSLDNDKEKWIKAINDDHLVWKHVSDLEGWNNAVAKQYAINSIPHTVLLDPDGKIIARGLSGAELEAKLNEIYVLKNNNQ